MYGLLAILLFLFPPSLDPPSSYRPDVYAGALCTAVRWFSQVPQVWNISFQCDFLSFLAILTEGQRVGVILIVLGIVEELILSFQRFEKAVLFPPCFAGGRELC